MDPSLFRKLRTLAARFPGEEPADVVAARESGCPTFGKFLLLGELGRGGFSVVHRAWQADMRRYVALKVVSGVNPRVRERFLAESRAAGRLSHPNILPVYESGEAGETLFMAMPLVAGRTLERCDLGPVAAARVVAEAARAVHAVHGQGLLHRDLKPGNLMREGERVYVMDFGLAKSIDGSGGLTLDGELLGTPSFMAPEQALCLGLDARTDVYGLGATLYSMLTWKLPYPNTALPIFLEMIRTSSPPPPSTFRPDVAGDLEAIILRAMERSPDARYATAAELADDLEAFVRGEAPRARPASGAVRSSRVGPPPLAGRTDELHRLVEIASTPGPRFAVVTGEAGVGKSRLLAEVVRAWSGADPKRWARVGNAVEGAPMALHPFASILRQQSGEATTLTAWMKEPMEALKIPAVERENMAHLIALSVGVSVRDTRVRHIDPARLRDETHHAWATWLRARALSGPVLLVIEDLQWADRATLALLESLPSRLDGARVTILASSRDASRVPAGFERFALGPMDLESVTALAQAFLGRAIDPSLAAFLANETGGLPAHLVALTQWLLEAGHIHGNPAQLRSRADKPPPGMNGLAAARMEALGPEEREVLKAGSVIGQAFWGSLLEDAIQRPADKALASLRRHDLLDAHAGSVVPGESQFAFQQSVLRDVAYALVPAEERVRLHLRAAEALEKRAETGGRRLLGLAATQREAGGQVAEAAKLWREAARLADLDAAAEEALACAREALRLGDEESAATIARELFNLGRYDEALRETERADLGPVARLRLLPIASEVLIRQGTWDKALALATEVLQHFPPPDVRLSALASRVEALTRLARFDDAESNIDEGLRLARAATNGVEMGRFLNLRGKLRGVQGRWTDALPAFEEALRILTALGDRRGSATLGNNIGTGHLTARRYEEALAAFQAALAVHTAIGDRWGMAMVRHNLGLALIAHDRGQESVAEFRESVALRRALGERVGLAHTLTQLGRILYYLKEYPEARRSLEEALGLLRTMPDRKFFMLHLESYAQILDASGDPEAAGEARAEAAAEKARLEGAGVPEGPSGSHPRQS